MVKARTWDPTAGFSIDLVIAGLGRLYTVEGGQLVPNLDSKQIPPACPITLSPFEDPVLLEDGFVYEQAAIVQWLGRHSKAPCTNKEVHNQQLLRLNPFRVVVNSFLDSKRDSTKSGWRSQLLKVEEEAKRSSSSLLVRCARVEQAIASCMAEATELQMGLQAAHCTADRLRSELCCFQETASVKLQQAARCWLARRQVRRLGNARAMQLVQSRLQVHKARLFLDRLKQRRLHAALRIQQWWKQHVKKMARRAKRQRQRQLKKERAKALRAETRSDPPCESQPCESQPCESQPCESQPCERQPRKNGYYWDPATGNISWHAPSEASSDELFINVDVDDNAWGLNSDWSPAEILSEVLPGWEVARDRLGRMKFSNSETRECVLGMFVVGLHPVRPREAPSPWRKIQDCGGGVCFYNTETLAYTRSFPKWNDETFQTMAQLFPGFVFASTDVLK